MVSISLYSNKEKEIKDFLDKFFNSKIAIDKKLKYDIKFENPTQSAELIGAFIEDNGCYYSNVYYKENRPTYTQYTRQTTKKYTDGELLEEYGSFVVGKDGKYYFEPSFYCPKEDYKTEQLCKNCQYYDYCKQQGEIKC